MELESLNYFMETAKSLSITETSERLFISQQTLINHIRRVEDYYGTRLFNRQPRLQLTAAGQEVLKYAETIFSDEKRLLAVLADLGNSDSGQMCIRDSFCTAPYPYRCVLHEAYRLPPPALRPRKPVSRTLPGRVPSQPQHRRFPNETPPRTEDPARYSTDCL